MNIQEQIKKYISNQPEPKRSDMQALHRADIWKKNSARRVWDVAVIGSASVIRQCIRAGLVDELQIDIMPILLGGGLRLFEGSEIASMQLERLNVVNLPGGRIHLRFRV